MKFKNIVMLQLVPTPLDECNDYMDQNPQNTAASTDQVVNSKQVVSTNSGVSEPEIHLQSSVAKSIARILGSKTGLLSSTGKNRL